MIKTIRTTALMSFIFGAFFITNVALTEAATGDQWEYIIYITQQTTGTTVVAKKWIETDKSKVIKKCITFSKLLDKYGIQCTWNEKTVYSKKIVIQKETPKKVVAKKAIVKTVVAKKVVAKKVTPVKVAVKKVIVPKTTTSTGMTTTASGSDNSELKLFEGYLDGRIVVTEKDKSKGKSLEICGQMRNANPKSEITCRWGDEVLSTTTVDTAVDGYLVDLVKATGVTGSYLAKNKEQEIGRFTLNAHSGATGAVLESITVSQNGSAKLMSLVDQNTNIKLIDIESWKEITAKASITDANISFTNMSESLVGNTSKSYKIMLAMNSLDGLPDMLTIGLILDPQSIKIYKKGSTTPIQLWGWVLAMQSYVIGSLPPTIGVTALNSNIFRIRVTNIDENYSLTLADISITAQVTQSSGTPFAPKACLRNSDSMQACWWNGTSTTSITLPSISSHISMLTGGGMNTYVEKGNGYLDVDLYVYSDAIFPTGMQVSVAVESIDYTINGKLSTQKYSWVTTAKATYNY